MSIFRRPNGCGGPAGAYLGLAILAAFIWITLGCGTPAPAADTVPGTIHVQPDLPIAQPAVATAAAVRITTTSTAPVEQAAAFDCATYVNGLPYTVNDPEPARLAYRVTAACRGWDQATITKWEHFIVDDVMQGESGFCPLVRGGATMTGVGCEVARQGRREDSGILQLIGLWYRPGGPLCVAEGMCSSDAIIASPWASFNAGLFAVEWDGRGPWSFNAWAKSFHPTWPTVTRYWP